MCNIRHEVPMVPNKISYLIPASDRCPKRNSGKIIRFPRDFRLILSYKCLVLITFQICKLREGKNN